MYFVVLGLVPQTNNYFSLMENLFEGKIRHVEVPEVVYKTNVGGYGVLPEKGDQCWVNTKCTMEKVSTVLDDKSFFTVASKKHIEE